MADRDLFLQLQKYCDIGVKACPEKELQQFVARHREGIDGNETEAALQMLALLLLTAADQHIRKIMLNGSYICLIGRGKGICTTLHPGLLARAREVINTISGMEDGRSSGTIRLAAKGCELPILVHPTAQDGASVDLDLLSFAD